MINIEKIGQIAIPVKDLTRAISFYKENLGLTLLFQTDTMAFFNCQGIRLLLSVAENESFDNASSVIYFQVANIKDDYKQLKEMGVHFIDEPHIVAKMNDVETWMTFFKDTEENVHALMSEVKNK